MRLAPITRDRVLIQIVLILGTILLLYPSAADWFSSRLHNSETSGYVQAVDHVPPRIRQDLLQLAENYNTQMPQGQLRDPYSAGDSGEEGAAYDEYTQLLKTSPNGVIGHLVYKTAGIDLPIYHGTGEDVLSKGVGHLYGSSLPVGGPGTHSVLTSHSGLVHSTLFSKLPKQAAIGDEFTIDVMGKRNHYRVDRILTVLPHESESLRIVDGEDSVTLITCTPIGVNTHRLLVRGTRIPAPAKASAPGSWIPSDGIVAGFPWWAVGLAAGVVFSFAVFATRKPPHPVLPSSSRPSAAPAATSASSQSTS